MKSVLISIQPKWCELIASGKKTVEVRKTRPKVDTPFKVYIYETQGRKYPFNVKADTIAKHDDDRFLDCVRGNPPIKEDKNGTPYFSYGRMKVIGEFVCNEIYWVTQTLSGGIAVSDMDWCLIDPDWFRDASCLTDEEVCNYLNDNDGYGWLISDLVIYDEPKELSEFFVYCDRCDKRPIACKFAYEENNENGYYSECMCDFKRPIERPPQSWCYVERSEG